MNNLFKEKYYSDSNILSNNELWKDAKDLKNCCS